MNPSLISFAQWLEHSSLSKVLENSAPLAVGVSIAHYLSFFILVGTSAIIDLRILGFAGRNQGVAEFTEPFFPWTWTALAVAVATGILEFFPDASIMLTIQWFYVKLLVTLVGAILLVVLQKSVPKWERLHAVHVTAKILAAASLILWIFTILSAAEVPQQANI